MATFPFAHASRARKPFYHERFRVNVLRSEAFNRGPEQFSPLFDSACSDRKPPLTAANQIRILGFLAAGIPKLVKQNRT